jgi:hypothetical protein
MARNTNQTFIKISLLFALVFLLIASQVSHFPAQEASFAQTLYPVLEKAACRACHTSDGVASVTRLIFPEEGANPARIEAFGASLIALIDRSNAENSLLFKKPTNRTPHAGGERIKRDSEDEKALLVWVQRLARMPDAELARLIKRGEAAEPAPAPPKVALRRLTHSQYNHTVRDLLGDQTAPASQFPPEDFVNGYKNQYQAQNLSPLLVEAYSAAAERLARNAFQGGDRRGLSGCTPSASCASLG